ncbi:MAG: VWA domain-containing protein [Thermoanaerobaculia bacterium]|nr:VWA domain-containing protein [Thermoanaerobaculia bacterium]
MSSSTARRSFAATAALLLAATGLVAQAPAAPAAAPAPLFGETVEVRVINVEVVVTDKEGLPVTGLQAADFVLKIDGEAQPIQYFTEVRGGDAIEGPADEPIIPGVPQLAPGTPVGTSYLVFIDDFYPLQRDRDKVIEKISADLARLRPEDRMAVVAYDGRKLEMLSSWSQSVPELERVFRKAMTRPALGLQREADDRRFSHDTRADRLTGNRPRLLDSTQMRLDTDERAYAETLQEQLQGIVAAAASALRGFANPPGRKVFVMLAGGWPYDPVQYAINDFSRTVLESQLKRGDELLAPLVGTANQLGYTIYSVDVPGLAEETNASAEYAAGSNFTDRNTLFQRENNVQYTLQYVATETGGKALLNGQREEVLARVTEDTRSYYWIGFAPTWQGDDAAHKVVLDTRVDGLRIRNRAGYVDFSSKSQTSMAVESILLFGDGPGASPLPFEIGKPTKVSGNRMNVPVTLRIPLSQLTIVPTDKGTSAEVELRIAALDERGGRSDIPVIPIRLDMPGKPPVGAYATYTTMIQLRRAKNDLVLAVSDPAGGAIYSARAEVNP